MTLLPDENIVSFQQIFYDANHPFYKFGGNTYHQSCFKKMERHEEYLRLYQSVDHGFERKRSLVTQESIMKVTDLHPDNAIYLGLLSDNENDDLFKYNFYWINLEDLDGWPEKSKFFRLLNVKGMEPGKESFHQLLERLKSSPKPRLSRELLMRYEKHNSSKEEEN